jgi:hypothetical protein
MKKLANAVVLALLAALAACGGHGNGNPIGPTGSTDVTISPVNFKVYMGTFINITVSGGDGSTYKYMLPNGGGAVNPLIPGTAQLQAATSPGTYILEVDSADKTAQTKFEVVDHSYLGLISSPTSPSVQSGATLSVKTPVTFKIQYAAEKGAFALVWWLDDQKKKITGSTSSGATLSNQNGDAEITATMTVPAKTAYAQILLVNLPADPTAVYASIDIPLSLTFQ